MIILYVVTGAAIFVVLFAPTSHDLYMQNKMYRIGNDTATVAELQGNSESERVVQMIARLVQLQSIFSGLMILERNFFPSYKAHEHLGWQVLLFI